VFCSTTEQESTESQCQLGISSQEQDDDPDPACRDQSDTGDGPHSQLYDSSNTDNIVFSDTVAATSSMAPADLMLLLLKLKHNLSKEATEDIAKLLKVVTGENVGSLSMHNIKKGFVSARDNVQIHHVCKYCGSYVGVVPSDVVHCKFSACARSLSEQESLKCGHFFFYLPLREQLIDLFENHQLSHFLHKSLSLNSTGNSNFSDIVNGNMYQSLHFSTSTDCKNLTLTFNCDGVPVFKSSSFSVWPILCCVNELPPAVRRSHILMAALWFGGGKPNKNEFLEPFLQECQVLASHGFSWLCPETSESKSCTATVIVGVCDAVARPLLQNFKQYNGFYGCGFCFDKGESVEKGNGRTTVYPFNNSMILRSTFNTSSLVAEALETKQPCMGVKVYCSFCHSLTSSQEWCPTTCTVFVWVL